VPVRGLKISAAALTRVRCGSVGSKTAVVVAATLVFAGGILAGGAAGRAGADPPAPPPQPKTTIDHDGLFVVGTDIVPGTYSSAGPVGTGTCYWKRLSSLNGKDIIDNALSSKPQVVEIEPTDTAFKTDGCQPWQKTDATAPGELPPPAAQAQLNSVLGDLNARAGQVGAGVPQP
jgi:hypothetical protein